MTGDPGSPPITIDPDYLAGVSPESIPMAISEHLGQVQLAVRSIVGNDIFAGAAFAENDPTNSRITIYGTDVDAIAAALDGIATALRDRITIAESAYSFAELRDVAQQADVALREIGLEPFWISARYDGSGVDVTLERVQDHTDEQLTSAANDALAGLPVIVTVSDPPTPF